MRFARCVHCGDAKGTRSGRLPFVVLAVVAMIAGGGLFSDAHAAPKKKPPKQGGKSVTQPAKSNDAKVAEDVSAKPSRAKRRGRKPLDPQIPRYLPDDARVFGWIDFPKVLDSPIGHTWVQADSDFWGEFGTTLPVRLKPEQIERIVFAGHSVEDFDKGVMMLFCTEPVETSEQGPAPDRKGWAAEKIGEMTVWTKSSDEPSAICVVEQNIILAGKPESVRAVLKRNGPAKLALALDRGRRLLDPSAAIALTMLPQAGLGTMNGMSWPVAANLVDRIEAVNLEFDFGADLAVRMAAICDDEAAAEQLKGVVTGLWTLVQLQGLQNQEPDVRKLLGSFSFDATGSVFNARIRVPAGMAQATGKSISAKPVPLAAATKTAYDAPTAKYSYPTGSVSPYSQATAGYGPATAGYGPATTGATLAPTVPPPSTTASSAWRAPSATSASPYQSPSSSASSTVYRAAASYPASGYSQNASHWQPSTTTLPSLKIADVIRLVEAGVDDTVIVRHVGKRQLAAALTADDLILLTESKVTTQVITALQGLTVRPTSKPSRPPTGRYGAAKPAY